MMSYTAIAERNGTFKLAVSYTAIARTNGTFKLAMPYTARPKTNGTPNCSWILTFCQPHRLPKLAVAYIAITERNATHGALDLLIRN